MTHAVARCDERLTDSERAACLSAADIFARSHRTGSHAILVAEMDRIRGDIWSNDSNGNTIVAIIRDGFCTTVMLRRKSQPFTREALRVDKCWKLKIDSFGAAG